MASQPRISVSSIAAAVREDPFVPAGAQQGECFALSPQWLAVWNALSPAERRAAEVVSEWLQRPAAVRAVPIVARVLRRRSLRRALDTMSPAERDSILRLRSTLAAQFGATRPIDAITPLCGALDTAGLPASQIVALLHALGIECAPRLGGRERVQRRVDRWRKRAQR